MDTRMGYVVLGITLLLSALIFKFLEPILSIFIDIPLPFLCLAGSVVFFLLFIIKYCTEKKQKRLRPAPPPHSASTNRTEPQMQRYVEPPIQPENSIDIKEKLKEEERLHQIKRYKAEADFNELLSIIPRAPILARGEKIERRRVSDFPFVKLSGITEDSNADTVGQFVVIDVETTGLTPGRNRIVEISAMRFERFKPVECFDSLINPQMHIPDEATAVNQITDDMVAAAPLFYQVAPDLVDFIGSSDILGHKVEFDLKFLYVNGVDLLEDKKRKFYDTLVLSKTVLSWDEVGDRTLTTLCEFFDIYRDNAHRACSDCLATGILFKQLIDCYQLKDALGTL